MPSAEFEFPGKDGEAQSVFDIVQDFDLSDQALDVIRDAGSDAIPGHDYVVLDPRWAIERAMIGMVEVSRRKRADYATDGDEFSNFRGTAEFAGFESPAMSALFNVMQKLERIRALRANGRLDDVANEAVADTFLDIAVYAVLAHAMWLEDMGAAEG